jgi:hypothetical protein
MKYLIQANSIVEGAELHLLKSMLERTRIACTIRNENLAGGMGEIPFFECYPELWIIDEQDYDKAKEIVSSWRQAAGAKGAVWVCPDCDELIDGQFTACWQCGVERG